MVIFTEADLIAAFVARRKELGMSQEALDQKAGTQDRYIGKLENPGKGRWSKRAVSPMFWVWFGALDLAFIAVPRASVAGAVGFSKSGALKECHSVPEGDTVGLAVKEAARALGISRRQVYRLVRQKRLRISKIGRRTLVLRASVETLLRRRAHVVHQ